MQWLRTGTAIAAAGWILIGVVIGYGVSNVQSQGQLALLLNSIHPLRLHDKRYPLVNPLVTYETPETTALKEYQKLKEKLQHIVDAQKQAGLIMRASVYYRNLDTGDWIGIDQNATYYPASLLKVPVMIAYFKEAETDPNILDERVTYTTITGGDSFETPSSLVVGKNYSVHELIEKMIVASDNGATYTLIEHMDKTRLNEVYTDLGIDHPDEDSSTYQIPTRTYALFFRVLYNATYLSTAYSQEALNLLTKATYSDGLLAGLPAGIPVAHKFGEHVVSSDRKTQDGVELHDCGIVYDPTHPYLLCIMTEAPTTANATNMLKVISKETYDLITTTRE